MIRYSGDASLSTVKLVVLGDGETKSVSIDLRKPPFGLDFQGNFPIDAKLRSDDQSMPTPDASIEDGVLTLDYPEPISLTKKDTMSPRSQLTVFLFYQGL